MRQEKRRRTYMKNRNGHLEVGATSDVEAERISNSMEKLEVL